MAENRSLDGKRSWLAEVTAPPPQDPTLFLEQFWRSRGLIRACIMDGFTDGQEDVRGTVCSLSALPPASLWRRNSPVARTGRTRLRVFLLLREGWVSIYLSLLAFIWTTWAGCWAVVGASEPCVEMVGRAWSEVEPLAWLQRGGVGGRAGSPQCAEDSDWESAR